MMSELVSVMSIIAGPSMRDDSLNPTEAPGVSFFDSPRDLLLLVTLLVCSWCLIKGVSTILDRRSVESRWSYARLGLIGWFVHGVAVIAIHYGAWVPVPLVAVYSSPLLVFPMVARWIYENPPQYSLRREKSLWRLDEISRAAESSVRSHVIALFRERYPLYRAYVYRRNLPYSVGGMLLQNRSRLSTPRPTYLEVTLDCPFGTRVGSFLEGHEVVLAYIFREQEDGSRIAFLPAQGWEEWLEGMRKLDWFKKIGEVDRLPPNWPCLGDLPYPLIAEKLEFQRITLH
ncbi:MAG: hypothetical protein ABIH23_04025 [bacterium]